MRRAIALKPDLVDAHIRLGTALLQSDRPDEAQQSFAAALALAPDSTEAHIAQSLGYLRVSQLKEAHAGFAKVVDLMPNSPMAHDLLGVALHRMDRHDEALESFDRAMALDPSYLRARVNSASSIRAAGDPARSLTMLDDVLAVAPDMHDAHHFRGMALWELDRREEALVSMEKACEIKPDLASAQFNAALLMLQGGDIEGGLPRYEWRKKIDNPVGHRGLKMPAWLGETPLAGRKLFVHAEQGLGDTLQFCRYLPDLVAQGAQVTFAVQSAVRPLLAHLEDAVTLIDEFAPAPNFDLHCPLLSLPLALGTTLGTIPGPIGYLHSDPARRAPWATLIPQDTGSRPRIGIAWSGNPDHRNDRHRSIPLTDFQSLLQFDAQWVVIQKDVRAADADILRKLDRTHHYPDVMRDFADTAALLDMVDLVITVDTSVAHLAGALGRRVWLLVAGDPDWRWMRDREDSPWYPTMRLFRQPKRGDWTSALSAVSRALLERYGPNVAGLAA